MPPTQKKIRIGCAGWSIPSRHAPLFGDGDSHLARYATRFDVAEINSTFYRPHQPRTFERWAASVPASFRFSVKLPRAITHDARLHGTGDALTAFFAEVAGLGPKLGGVLVQLPPSLVFESRLADRFFAMLKRRTGVRVACEPRHPSWFTPAADVVMGRHACTTAAMNPRRCRRWQRTWRRPPGRGRQRGASSTTPPTATPWPMRPACRRCSSRSGRCAGSQAGRPVGFQVTFWPRRASLP